MRRHLGLLLLLGAGCSAYERPTAERLDALGVADDRTAKPSPALRVTFRMSVDSPSLTGEFDGVALATGVQTPAVRAQVFGDLGPKVMDLSARPERIVGYFPQTMEGVDCALPGEAAPHLLLFMGATLLEDLIPLRRSRVTGILEEEGGAWLRLEPAVPGLATELFLGPKGGIQRRRFTWIYGVRWEEERTAPEEWRITAANVDIRVKIVERVPANPAAVALTLPADVRLTRGSRK